MSYTHRQTIPFITVFTTATVMQLRLRQNLSVHRSAPIRNYTSFYPHGASSARVLAIIVCPCVCVSVCLCDTRRYCIKKAKRSITQTTPRDS